MENLTVHDISKQRWIVISVAFASFMCQLDNYIVNISLPTIADYFNIATGEVSRIVLIYLLVLTSTLLIFGKLADKVGLRNLLMGGYFFFTLGSLLCGISSGINMLIFSRAVQAVGGSMLYIAAFAIVPRFLPKEITGWAFGIISTTAALGVTVGAPVGGFITGLISWHWIFLINVPFGIVAVLVALKVIPGEKKNISLKNLIDFDIPGGILSFTALLTFIYALNTGQELGWTSLTVIASFFIFFISTFYFIYRESKISDPLLNLKLFKNKEFTLTNLSTFMAFLLISGNVFILPFYLEFVKKLETQEAGLVLLIYSLVYMVVSPLAGRLSDKVSSHALCNAGMISAAFSCLVFALTINMKGLLSVIVFLVWIAVSLGLFASPNNKQVMKAAPEDSQGTASGVFNMIKNLGLVMGVCAFETLFSQSISSSITDLSKVDITLLCNGFRNVYILGMAACILSMIFSALTGIIPQNTKNHSNS